MVKEGCTGKKGEFSWGWLADEKQKVMNNYINVKIYRKLLALNGYSQISKENEKLREPYVSILIAAIVASFLVLPYDVAFANPRVKELQHGLNELRYDAGPEDGNIGAATRKAIKAFQRYHDLEVDGKYSDYYC